MHENAEHDVIQSLLTDMELIMVIKETPHDQLLRLYILANTF